MMSKEIYHLDGHVTRDWKRMITIACIVEEGRIFVIYTKSDSVFSTERIDRRRFISYETMLMNIFEYYSSHFA